MALLQEQQGVSKDFIRDYEQKSASLTQVLVDAERDPKKCINMSWARVDMLEMAGDKPSLEKVRVKVLWRLFSGISCKSYLTYLHYLRRYKWRKTWKPSTM